VADIVTSGAAGAVFRFFFAIQTISEIKTKYKGDVMRPPLPFLPLSVPRTIPQEVGGASRGVPELLHDVRVDHRRLDVRVAMYCWICLMSTPLSSRWVAKQRRSVWTETGW
jgi:hypothetical protein